MIIHFRIRIGPKKEHQPQSCEAFAGRTQRALSKSKRKPNFSFDNLLCFFQAPYRQATQAAASKLWCCGWYLSRIQKYFITSLQLHNLPHTEVTHTSPPQRSSTSNATHARRRPAHPRTAARFANGQRSNLSGKKMKTQQELLCIQLLNFEMLNSSTLNFSSQSPSAKRGGEFSIGGGWSQGGGARVDARATWRW